MKPIALVVDDEPLIRMDTADLVAEAGYDVIEAEDGCEAISYLAAHPTVCLVITDIQMPEVDGLTLARHIAAHWPSIAIIIASGAVLPAPGEFPADARFISKPFSPAVVLETIIAVRALH